MNDAVSIYMRSNVPVKVPLVINATDKDKLHSGFPCNIDAFLCTFVFSYAASQDHEPLEQLNLALCQ